MEEDVYLTIAQLALGIAGFSGVMTAFMKRPGKLTTVEIFRVGVLLGVTFGAMFLALLPIVLEQSAVGGRTLWIVGAVVMAVCSALALGLFLYTTSLVYHLAPEIFNPWMLGLIATGHAANVAVQLASAAHPGNPHAPGIYTAGLCWFLAHAAIQFSRMLFVQPTDR